MKKWLREGKMSKLFNEYNDNSYQCNCGHKVFILAKQEKRLCTWCGHYVFKNKRDKDLYRINELLRRKNNDR